MKKEINRYTLNIIADGVYIPIAHSTIENIDSFTSNFGNRKELITFINEYTNYNSSISDLSITYHINQLLRDAPVIYRSHQGIVDDKRLIDNIIKYFSQYDNVRRLDMKTINNGFLEGLLFQLVSLKWDSNRYNFILNKVKRGLVEEYKLKRDCAIFLENQMQKSDRNLLTPPTGDKPNLEKIKIALSNINMVGIPLASKDIEPEERKTYPETGDPDLDYLLAHGDFDTISRIYSLEELKSLGVNIFDSIRNVDEEKGRSR